MATDIKDHGSRAHALLSASSAYRWLACTPSARLEETFSGDEEESVFAAEGTFAHEIAELEILYQIDRLPLSDFQKRRGKLELSEFSTTENDEEVEKYVNYVLDIWDDAKALDRYAEIHIEDKMDLSEFVPEGFGTNDVVILAGDVLDVIDLKFGKGVKVRAYDNPQLKLYALGALVKHNINFGVKTVRLHIHQPRLGGASVFELSAEALQDWARLEVKPLANLAFDGLGEFAAGEHCRFCKVAPRCRALASHNLELAKHDFAEPNLLTDDELLNVFDKIDVLTGWASKVAAYIYTEALNGKAWKGYKLVEGKSNRQITDEGNLVASLLGGGFKRDSFTNEKLKGIGDLTKLTGKAKFKTLVEPYLFKPAGKPTLVLTDDPRAAYQTIEQHKQDFA